MNEHNKDTQLDQIVLEASALVRAGDSESTPASQAHVPDRILVVPWGEVRSAAGTFLADAEALTETVAEFEEHGTDLPIDYEHQSLGGSYSSPTGLAPAAGWIKSLKQVAPEAMPCSDQTAACDAGLWAEVTWTDAARERLANRHYRYLSPVALVRRSDRRLVGLHSVALTNKPAIVGMKPVVNQRSSADALKPNIDADEQIELTALRKTLAMDEMSDAATVLAAALTCIRTLKNDAAMRIAADRVSEATAEGKLTPAQREWALTLALRDPSEFDEWFASAPRVVALGRSTPPDDPQGGQSLNLRSIESAARAEWHTNKAFLETICTEEAYVANALRGSEASGGGFTRSAC